MIMDTAENRLIPADNNLTTVEKLMKDIRRTPICRQLIPMEANTGWPIPSKKNGRVYITLPYYGAQIKEKGKTILYPPLALLTVDCQTMTVVNYVNTRYTNPWPEGNWQEPAGYFPHEAIRTMSISEYKDKKHQIMGLYDILIRCLIDGKNLDREADDKLSKLLILMMEPDLKPFYKSISPGFFGHYLKE